MNEVTVKRKHVLLKIFFHPKSLFQAFLFATRYKYIITYAISNRKLSCTAKVLKMNKCLVRTPWLLLHILSRILALGLLLVIRFVHVDSKYSLIARICVLFSRACHLESNIYKMTFAKA